MFHVIEVRQADNGMVEALVDNVRIYFDNASQNVIDVLESVARTLEYEFVHRVLEFDENTVEFIIPPVA